MPVSKRKTLVQVDPDDPDAVVEYCDPESITTFEGSGENYFARILQLNNSKKNTSRITVVRKIYHRKRLLDDEEDDPDGAFINVEVILQTVTTESSGEFFRRRIQGLNPNDKTNERKFHIKRVFGKNPDGTKNEDVWLDDKRWDEFFTSENSGFMFIRRQWKMLWDDESDDNDFDKNDLVALPAPTDPAEAYRPSFGHDIVNISPGGVAEFEIEHKDAEGVTHDAQATLSQADTKVEDSIKFTASIFFNFDEKKLPGDADASGAFFLLEFGGGAPGDPGTPFTSRIVMEKVFGEFTYQIRVALRGPVIEADWGITPSFYGTFLEDATRRFSRVFEGVIPIDGEAGVKAFQKNWHHLAISADVGDDFLDNDTEVGWEWLFEGDGVFGGIPNPGIAPFVDPANVIYNSLVINQSGNADGDPINVDLDLLPDPATMQQQRIYVRKDDGGWGLIYAGFAFTSAPVTREADPKHGPMQMWLDDKSKQDYAASGEDGMGKITLTALPDGTGGITAPDDKEGIPVKGKIIGVPMQPATATGGDALPVITRLAVYQVWFDKFVDFNDEATRRKFLAVTTNPDTKKKTGKPAGFTEADLADAKARNIPQDQMLSPAALKFGKPQMFMRGGKGSFIKNKGTAGAFVKANDIENYSPGPSKIPIA